MEGKKRRREERELGRGKEEESFEPSSMTCQTIHRFFSVTQVISITRGNWALLQISSSNVL